MTTTEPAGDESAHDQPALSLAEFAAVQAAEQDEIPMEEALADLGVTEEVYATERPDKLAEIASGASAFRAYQAALEEAQDALHRPVAPLFDDVAAWMAYNLALTEGPARDVLEAHGLTVGDMARLERHWRARIEADDEVATAAKEARKAGVPDPLPPLEIGERQSAKRAEAQSAASVAEGEDAAPPVDLFDAVELAAVFQAMLDEGVDEATLIARGASSEEQARAHVADTLRRAEPSADLMTFYRGRVEHVRRLLKARAAGELPTPAAPMLVQPPGHAPIDATGPVEGLRFDATGFLDPISFRPEEALPFNEASPPGAPVPIADALDPSADQGATSMLDPAQFKEMPLPFGGEDEPSFDATSAIDPSQFQHLELPFQAPREADTPAPVADELDPAASMGETSALDPSQFRHLALPFDEASAPTEAHAVTDLRRYASFCVDLELYAAHEAAVRERYAIKDERLQRELVTEWEKRLNEDPALRAELEQAKHTYRQWLQTHHPP